MSENINPDQCSRVMAAPQANEPLLSLDIWDHPDIIGPEFDFEGLLPKDASTPLGVSSGSAVAGTASSLAPSHPAAESCSTSPSTSTSMQGHAAVATDQPNQCIECGETYPNKDRLGSHGWIAQHLPFQCTCGSRFSRSDVLTRHLKTKSTKKPQHPCPYCKRHRGKSAFIRRDHLKQHIVEYHKHDAEQKMPGPKSQRLRPDPLIAGCPEPDCPEYRDVSFYCLPGSVQKKESPFAKYSDYSKHMKINHDMSHFPCTVPRCNRIGAKGYFREKDLVKHRRSKHPDAPPSSSGYGFGSMQLSCPYPGCEDVESLYTFYSHVRSHCSEEQNKAYYAHRRN